MLFMVIERFKDAKAVGERFRQRGRMLPEGVSYHASWIDPVSARCFQVMEASRQDLLEKWFNHWNDLIDFELIKVVTSSEYWSRVEPT